MESQTGYKALRIEDLPRNLQPRQMLKRMGAKHSSDDTLLAVILRAGIPRANVVEVARRLLAEFGTLESLSRATCDEIISRRIPGIGEAKALQIVAAIELGRRCAYSESSRLGRDGDVNVKSSEDVYELLIPHLYGSRQEKFFVVLLGPRNRLIGNPREFARGQRDEVALQPNLVFETAMKEGARSIIVAHNHPSGDPTPSEEDVTMTRKLIDAGRLLNVPLLDHLIIGAPMQGHSGFFSLAASGIICFN